MIVAICGGDANGKQTQSKILAERLNASRVAFPNYETTTGKAILSLLKEQWEIVDTTLVELDEDLKKLRPQRIPHMSALVLQSLMTTNRLELLPEINEHIKNGRHIVFDRYYASGLVYGGLDGLDREWIQRIQAPLPEPDLWILLDIPVEESIRRRPERRDRYEKEPGFQEKVRNEYFSLFEERRAKEGSAKWAVIGGLGTVEEVAERIWNRVEPRLAMLPKTEKQKRELAKPGPCEMAGCANEAMLRVLNEGPLQGKRVCFQHLPE